MAVSPSLFPIGHSTQSVTPVDTPVVTLFLSAGQSASQESHIVGTEQGFSPPVWAPHPPAERQEAERRAGDGVTHQPPRQRQWCPSACARARRRPPQLRALRRAPVDGTGRQCRLEASTCDKWVQYNSHLQTRPLNAARRVLLDSIDSPGPQGAKRRSAACGRGARCQGAGGARAVAPASGPALHTLCQLTMYMPFMNLS